MAETDYEQGEDQAQELKSLGAMLQARFLTYKDARKETENEWIKDLRQYSGQYEPEVIAKLNEAGARSKVFVGLTRTKVMAAYSRIIDLLFQTGDSFYGIDPTPRPRIDPMQSLALRQQAIAEVVSLANPGQSGADPEMVKQIVMEREDELNEAVQDAEKEIAESAAEEMKVDIDDWLVEGGVDQKMKQSILESCIFGSGAIKAGTVKIDQVQSYAKVMQEDGTEGFALVIQEAPVPEIESVSIFDFYPDPYCTTLEDCAGVFRRHVLTKRQFKDLGKLPGFDDETIKNICKTNHDGNHTEESHERTRREIAGLKQGGESHRFEVLEFWGSIDGYDLKENGVELPDDADLSMDFDANIWICDNKVVRSMLNPVRGYKIPYHVFPYEKTPHQFWGTGVPRMMRDSQQTMNAATRIWLDNLALSSGPMCEVNTDLLAAGEDPTDIHPWRVFLREGGDGAMQAVRFYQPIANANGLNQIVEIFRRFADETTSLPSYTHGEQTRSLNKTATGMSMLMGAANVALKSTIKNLDDFLIRPMIEAIFHFAMEFGSNPKAKGDLKIHAKGSTALIQREVQSQRLLQFLSLVSNEMDVQTVDRTALLREIAQSMDIDPEKFVFSEEQIAAQQQAILQQQMLAGPGEGAEPIGSGAGMGAPDGVVAFPS